MTNCPSSSEGYLRPNLLATFLKVLKFYRSILSLIICFDGEPMRTLSSPNATSDSSSSDDLVYGWNSYFFASVMLTADCRELDLNWGIEEDMVVSLLAVTRLD
jgi:hypothetical protein